MEKKRPGRKTAEIDAGHLEVLAERQWSLLEIAAFFRVSHDTIERRFASKIKEARLRGHAKIRDLQWKRALEGSDKMIVHMSEHYLEQHQEVKTTVVSDKVAAMSDDELKKRMDRLEQDV